MNETRRFGFRLVYDIFCDFVEFVEFSYGDVDDLNLVFDCAHIVQGSAFIIDQARVDEIKLCAFAPEHGRINCARFFR